MSKSSIPQKIQSALWAHAAGRCQYRGCNADLVGDLVAGRQDKPETYGQSITDACIGWDTTEELLELLAAANRHRV